MSENFMHRYTMHTHTCGELRIDDVGTEVTLTGWVDHRRDHGGLIFVDLRDREGVTQCVFDPDDAGEAFGVAERIRPEWVVLISGKVRKRPAETENPNMPTGEVDVVAGKIEEIGRAHV